MTCDSHTNLIPELQFFMIPIPIPIPLELIPILIPIPASYDSDSNSDSNKPGLDSDSDSGIWFRFRNHWCMNSPSMKCTDIFPDYGVDEIELLFKIAVI